MLRLIRSTSWETKLVINRFDQNRQQRCAGSASAHGTFRLHWRKIRLSGAARKEFYSIQHSARSAVSIADICNTDETTTLYYSTHVSYYYISSVSHARITHYFHSSRRCLRRCFKHRGYCITNSNADCTTGSTNGAAFLQVF